MKNVIFLTVLFFQIFIHGYIVNAQDALRFPVQNIFQFPSQNETQFPSLNAAQLPALHATKFPAHRLSTTEPTTVSYSSSELPQWVRDLRRFDIIAFGTFPFSMFIALTVSDLIRWGNANGFDTSEEGRRYAPLPAKSAGAAAMTNDDYLRTILIAAGISMAAALVDFIIVKVKQSGERQRLENTPEGTVTIERISAESEKETETTEE